LVVTEEPILVASVPTQPIAAPAAPEQLKVKAPKPVKIKEPKPVKVKAPKPVKVKEPKPVKVKAPKPVKIKEPKPVKVKAPKPVKALEPKPSRAERKEAKRQLEAAALVDAPVAAQRRPVRTIRIMLIAVAITVLAGATGVLLDRWVDYVTNTDTPATVVTNDDE
jgi:hypothetical protein